MAKMVTNMINEAIVSVELSCTPELVRSVFRPCRPLTCPFFVRINDFTFPTKSWDDFAVPILTAWIESLREFVSQRKASVVLRFMDGPYFIQLVRQSNMCTLMTCSKGDVNKSEDFFSTYINAICFMASVTDCARRLVSVIESTGIYEIDVSDLCEMLSRPNDEPTRKSEPFTGSDL